MQNQASVSRSGDGYAAASIMVLPVLASAMLFALFTRAEPHPPLEVEPFALGPCLAVSLATGAAAYGLMVHGMRFAAAVAPLFALTAPVSNGSQKYVDPAFPKIRSAVIAAQLSIAVILSRAVLQAIRLVRLTGGGLA